MSIIQCCLPEHRLKRKFRSHEDIFKIGISITCTSAKSRFILDYREAFRVEFRVLVKFSKNAVDASNEICTKACNSKWVKRVGFFASPKSSTSLSSEVNLRNSSYVGNEACKRRIHLVLKPRTDTTRTRIPVASQKELSPSKILY